MFCLSVLAGAAPAAAGESTFGLAEGKPGIEFQSAGNGFYVNAWLRAQLRYSNPFDANPRSLDMLENPPGSDFGFRRSRIKTRGYIGAPWFGFYTERSLQDGTPLLDLRLDLQPRDDLKFRIGQYKVLYTRERVDSSGAQQMVERSIVNRTFTLDRQRGITVSKRLQEGGRFDSWLDLGIFEGEGRDPGNLDGDPLYIARWQWHLLGRELPYGQSDPDFTQQPTATLAFAGASVRGPYTRYSGAGGGQLDGFMEGGSLRYDIRQWAQEFAWRFMGMSVQQEYHEKRVEDLETGVRSLFRGWLLQAGKAWPISLGGRQRALELAGRVARLYSRNAPEVNAQDELSLAVNLFLNGHENKFTAELSRIGVDESPGEDGQDLRFRLQWDVSF